MANPEEMNEVGLPKPAKKPWEPNPLLLTEDDPDLTLPRLEVHLRIEDGVHRQAPEPVNSWDFEGNDPGWRVVA